MLASFIIFLDNEFLLQLQMAKQTCKQTRTYNIILCTIIRYKQSNSCEESEL